MGSCTWSFTAGPIVTHDVASRDEMGWPRKWRSWHIAGLTFGVAWMGFGTWDAWANVVNGRGDAQLDIGKLRLWIMWGY